MTVCACIVNGKNVANLDFWQITLDSKFVVVFAKRASYVVHMVAWLIFLAQHGNVMISAVHSRTHKIVHTCIAANVFAECMFQVTNCRYQISVRTGNETSRFQIQFHRRKTIRNKNVFIFLANTLADFENVEFLLLRTIRNAKTATKIDEVEANA